MRIQPICKESHIHTYIWRAHISFCAVLSSMTRRKGTAASALRSRWVSAGACHQSNVLLICYFNPPAKAIAALASSNTDVGQSQRPRHVWYAAASLLSARCTIKLCARASVQGRRDLNHHERPATGIIQLTPDCRSAVTDNPFHNRNFQKPGNRFQAFHRK
jgi:hypothetical protein